MSAIFQLIIIRFGPKVKGDFSDSFLTIANCQKALSTDNICPTLLARVYSVPVGRRSGGRLAMTLVAAKNYIIFFSFFSPLSTFLKEGMI